MTVNDNAHRIATCLIVLSAAAAKASIIKTGYVVSLGTSKYVSDTGTCE